MNSWQTVWRDGFAPGFSMRALENLRHALIHDDSRLTQGATTSPPPLQCVLDWPADGACAITWAGWNGAGRMTVGELDEFFARSCYEADCRLGEPAACRWFLNWYDETPRPEMRRQLLAEVNRELAERRHSEVHEVPLAESAAA